MNSEIIIAQSTSIGSGAIAMIRLSGGDIRSLLDQTVELKSKKKLITVATHTVHFGTIVNANKKILDQVLIFVMDGPKSFTGENTVEISCHNNQFIINNIMTRIISCGARLALPGEFCERAMMNKKIDIFQAEAINELLIAQNELATESALAQLEGSLSYEIEHIDSLLTIVAAWCQASFEFLDEERDFRITIQAQVETIIQKITTILKNFNFQKIIKEGIKIAIIGSVNVGKSSLLNSLLGYNRAIVTPIAGTTRDTIEASIYKKNMNWTFIDTAGIRATKNSIEQEGIKKSYFEAAHAEIILLVYDSISLKDNKILTIYKHLLSKYQEKIILVNNKSDIIRKNNGEDELLKNNKNYMHISVSAKENIGIKSLTNLIEEIIQKKYSFQGLSYIVNIRHTENLTQIIEKLETIKKLLSQKNPYYEIIMMHIFKSQEIITRLSGKTVEEKAFDTVFRSFCVGK